MKDLPIVLGVLGVLVGCGGASPATPPASPAPPASVKAGVEPNGSAASSQGDPFALPGPMPADDVASFPATTTSLDAYKRATRVPGIGPAPTACRAFASRTKIAAPDLATALAEEDPARRDAMLVGLEGKADEKTPGLVRALRADLAPLACADAIVDPFLDKSASVQGPVGSVLVGLSLAAKLTRTAGPSPLLTNATDKKKVLEFVRGPFRTWFVEQATMIETLSAGAAGLTGYGRGIAAVEAGSADLRLVDRARSSPVPAGWDAELRGVYEAALDEALEPRKRRGRDAALVGLADFAQAGIVHDARVDRARMLLSKLYGGHRIDALDGLLLPITPPPSPTGDRVAMMVTTFWFDLVPDLGRTPEARRSSFQHGAPHVLRGEKDFDRENARSRMTLGRTYWRRDDFLASGHLASRGNSPDDRFLLALSVALAYGPKNASDMMRVESPSALDLRHTDALDVIAREKGLHAGRAAFDAAYLRALCPPEGAAASAHFRDVAARFRNAAALLENGADKSKAEERAKEADALAAATEKKAP